MEKKKITQHKAADKLKESENKLVLSYMTMRNLIGISGLLLPVILVIFSKSGKSILPTISEYYYTGTGDVLVVILSVLAVFLLTYNGYTIYEKFLTILAAVSAIGIGFCPMSIEYDADPLSIHTKHNVPEIFGKEWHIIFAALFFISISIISLYYFPMSNKTLKRKPGEKRTQKEYRNIVFRVCGIIMLASIAIIGAYFIWMKDIMTITGNTPVIFIFETIAIWAFAVSWLTKGQSILPDDEYYIVSTFKDIKKSF